MEYASAPELPVLLRYFHDLPRWMDGSTWQRLSIGLAPETTCARRLPVN
jgi:hypothetical protein